MQWPPRLLFALIVAGILALLLIAAVVLLPRRLVRTPASRGRWLVVGAVVLALATLIGWILLVLPAYWD